MSFIEYQADNNILVMTRGHAFNHEDFYSIFDAMPGVHACAVAQPASQVFFAAALAAPYDAFVLYDMPGMDFHGVGDDGLAPSYVLPTQSCVDNFLELLERGRGFVFLHHAIAAWPAWPLYAEVVGGKFLYKPDSIRGEHYPDSGDRHDINHRVSDVAEHPVTAGVAAAFEINDELYLAHVFDDSIVPLLVSDYDLVEDNFYSAQQAVQGKLFSRQGWHHEPGHKLLGWVKSYRNSPIVYLQSGDGKAA